MKALTVQQPWAWAIIHGGKPIENRTQLWAYRGPLAIHAGARWSQRGAESPLVQNALAPWLTALEQQRPLDSAEHQALFKFRAIIGLVDVTDTHWSHPHCCDDNPWAEQDYIEHGGRKRVEIAHLVLAHPRSVIPIECTGRLGLWTPPTDIADQLDQAA